jgi:hypothetical protein
VVGVKRGGVGCLAVLPLPEIAEITWTVDLPFVPEIVVCSKDEWICYLAADDGVVSRFHFGI